MVNQCTSSSGLSAIWYLVYSVAYISLLYILILLSVKVSFYGAWHTASTIKYFAFVLMNLPSLTYIHVLVRVAHIYNIREYTIHTVYTVY